MKTSCLLFVTFLNVASGFVPASRSVFVAKPLFLERQWLTGREFQLEEQEDKDTAITDLFLNADRSVSFGQTNGPIPIESRGSWDFDSEQKFSMRLVRKYETGDEGSTESNLLNRVGPFHYETQVDFHGAVVPVGEKKSIQGTLHTVDEDEPQGYFSMIDAEEDGVGPSGGLSP